MAEGGLLRKTMRAIERDRRRCLREADVPGLRDVLERAQLQPESKRREQLVFAARQNVRFLEGRLASGCDARPLRKRLTRRGMLLIAVWITVWIAAAATVDRTLLRTYAASHHHLPTANLVAAVAVFVTLALVGGLLARRTARATELIALAALAALIVLYMVIGLEDIYNAGSTVEETSESDNPLQTGVLVLIAFVPVLGVVFLGRSIRIGAGWLAGRHGRRVPRV